MQQFPLRFENTIPFEKSFNTPNEVYRYFSFPEHRENFLNGFIQFSGPNKLRHFMDSEKDIFNDDLRRKSSNNDQYEYRTPHGSHLHTFSLSFSKSKIKPDRPNIIVTNVNGLLEEINSCMNNANLPHMVSFLDLSELKKISPSITGVLPKKYPTHPYEILSGHINHHVSGRSITYIDKNNSAGLGIEAAMHNISIHKYFENENEYRIEIHFSLLESSCENLHNLVEYVTIKCPNIEKYCHHV